MVSHTRSFFFAPFFFAVLAFQFFDTLLLVTLLPCEVHTTFEDGSVRLR